MDLNYDAIGVSPASGAVYGRGAHMRHMAWLFAAFLPSVAVSQNLIVDGDFATPAGPSTFSTGYTNISCGGGTQPGQYLIATNPHACNSGFASFGNPSN